MSLVWFGIGSNRERSKHIRAGIRALHDAFASAERPLEVSRVFESDAVGFTGRRFYNLVARIETEQSLSQISAICKDIERRLGHLPSATRYSPRTLDIDLLLFDDIISAGPIQLPRAEILTNAFVLWPLAELAPDHKHPETGLSFATHWQQYHKEQIIEAIAFQFEPLEFLTIVAPSDTGKTAP